MSNTRNFTDQWVQGLTTELANEVYYDAQVKGLSIRVSKTGRKTWQVFYRVKGDPTKRVKKLGEYGKQAPKLGLKDARLKAASFIDAAREGDDPAAPERANRKSATFEDLAADFMEYYAAIKTKPDTALGYKQILNKDVLPRWGKRRIADIKRKDVNALLDGVMERGVAIHANRVLALVRKIFNWALSRDLIEANPAAMIPAPQKERERERVLTDAEIKAFWAACGKVQALQGASLRLMLVTAQRGGEVRSMRWADVDLDAKWWTIPPEMAKNGIRHRVPLTAQAIEILEELKVGATSPWIFPSRMKKGDGPITRVDATARDVRRKMAEKLGVSYEAMDFEPHDLRRTATTGMTQLGIARLIVSRVLNHAEGGVTSIYDRYSYDTEKRQALEAWAVRLADIIGEGVAPQDDKLSARG